jgi:predicted Zn-ribbon and HTH transcriptional regulator
MKQTKCAKCGYRWETRVAKPKACPRCKTRLDIKRNRRL